MNAINNARREIRKGAAAVEFAITAPLLFLLVFGAMELSHANMVLHTIEAAAYEGARQGIVPGANAQECRDAAEGILAIGRVKQPSISVVPANLDTESDDVTVLIDVRYDLNTVVTPLFVKNLIFRRTCTLQRE